MRGEEVGVSEDDDGVEGPGVPVFWLLVWAVR